MKEEVLDELEALQSLYDDVRILSETCWEIPLKSDKGFEAQLRVELTGSYPETFPNISITAYWMDAMNKACLLSRMESEFDPGCPGVVTWAEMLREELNIYEEKSEDVNGDSVQEEKEEKIEEKPKRRSILCVTQQLLLDGWTDLHETLGAYITRLGLLHGVLFHFRLEPRNRKCDCFRKPEVGTGS